MDHQELLRQLIAFPTVNNPAENLRPTRECPEFLENQLREAGVDAKILEQQGYFSVLGTIGTGRPVTLLLAHFDVVPIGPGWDTDPFELTIRGNKAYGRGTADDKGNVTALLLAAEEICTLELPGTVIVAMTGDEEIGGNNGAPVVRSTLELKGLFPDYLITADGVGMQIVTRRRNTCGVTISVPENPVKLHGSSETHRFLTEFVGRQSRHSAYFLPGVDRHALLAASNFLLQHPQVQVGHITGSFLKSNVVPDWFELEAITPSLNKSNFACDSNLTRLLQTLLPLSRVQFPVKRSDYGVTFCPNLLQKKGNRWEVYLDGRAMTTDSEPVEAAMHAILAEKLQQIDYQLVVHMGKAYMNTPTESKLVKTAQRIAEKFSFNTQPIELGGASDTRHFSDRPIEAIDFGPIGFGVHGSNEYVLLDSLPRTASFYSKLIQELHG
ncbi:MAG: M20/M25/M40 family metallo-hydrolase [Candidatus Hodarchaeota archaeon]